MNLRHYRASIFWNTEETFYSVHRFGGEHQLFSLNRRWREYSKEFQISLTERTAYVTEGVGKRGWGKWRVWRNIRSFSMSALCTRLVPQTSNGGWYLQISRSATCWGIETISSPTLTITVPTLERVGGMVGSMERDYRFGSARFLKVSMSRINTTSGGVIEVKS